MKSAPLQLENLIVGEIHLRGEESALGFSDDVKLDVKTDYGRHQTDFQRWKVSLRVSFTSNESKPIPYTGEVCATGIFFVADQSLSNDNHLALVAVNGPSIVFSSIRQLIALVSGQGANGKFLLPSMSFADQRIVAAEEEKNTSLPAPPASLAEGAR